MARRIRVRRSEAEKARRSALSRLRSKALSPPLQRAPRRGIPPIGAWACSRCARGSPTVSPLRCQKWPCFAARVVADAQLWDASVLAQASPPVTRLPCAPPLDRAARASESARPCTVASTGVSRNFPTIAPSRYAFTARFSKTHFFILLFMRFSWRPRSVAGFISKRRKLGWILACDSGIMARQSAITVLQPNDLRRSEPSGRITSRRSSALNSDPEDGRYYHHGIIEVELI